MSAIPQAELVHAMTIQITVDIEKESGRPCIDLNVTAAEGMTENLATEYLTRTIAEVHHRLDDIIEEGRHTVIERQPSSGKPVCPECEQGKHLNCTGWALDSTDREVACGCTCRDTPSAG